MMENGKGGYWDVPVVGGLA
jgi:hypothetical protein